MSQSRDDKRPLIGMIGGSGLYDMEGLSNTQLVRVESAFGEPSDDLLFDASCSCRGMDGAIVFHRPR